MENLFDLSSLDINKEVFIDIFSHKNIRIEKIISTGQTSDKWYNQNEGEWVCVLHGEGELIYEDGSKKALKQGDSLFIPAHKKHKVSYTANPCIWLCIFIAD